MRSILFILFPLWLLSCETNKFDGDKRQIAAKDEIRTQLPHGATAFDISHFREDTLSGWPDTAFRRPIQYTLDFEYRDSLGVVQQKTGYVFFTPDGQSIIKTQITNRGQ